MNDSLSTLYDRVTKDISQDSPCGEPAKSDERFDRVKTEIMKLTVSSGEGINWSLIRENCEDLLETKTKDLTVVAYLMLALLRLNSYPGLLIGLRVVHHMLDVRWEGMYPPAAKKKARINTFEWINERVSLMVAVTAPKPSDVADLHECKDLAHELPDKVRKAVGEPVTGFSDLRAELNTWAQKHPPSKPQAPHVLTVAPATHGPMPLGPAVPGEPQPTPKAADAAAPSPQTPEALPDAPATASAPRPAPPPSVKKKELDLPPPIESVDSIRDGLKAIVKIIHLVRECEPRSPVPYRLARVVRWEGLGEVPTPGDDGRTLVPAPLSQQLELMAAQRAAGKWDLLTETAEHAFLVADNSLFDIGLQHTVFQGLTNLGAEAAAEVVRIETGRLLHRFPQILDLVYNTGRPFADSSTRQWAMTCVNDARGTQKSDTAEQLDDDWMSKAHSLAQSKGLPEAMAFVSEIIDSAPHERLKMKRQLSAANFCTTHGRSEWAIPVLRLLDRKIDKITLKEWDPEFCAEVWESLAKGLSGPTFESQPGTEERAYVQALRDKLFEVSLEKAASVTPKSKRSGGTP
jgi:type VI secretion system protein VasJ